MKKYAVTFRWFKDYYCTELLMRRTYYVKANNDKDAEHKAFQKLDKEFNSKNYILNIIDEITMRDLTTKRRRRKDRYNILYSL